MTDGAVIGHKKWATELTQLLRAVVGDERFPIDVEKLAMEMSASRFPKDPLKAIKGGNLPGFEGALYPLGAPCDGWAIIYNNTNVSPGRIRFTTGHEFGHYLAHRHLLSDGIECDDKVVIQRAGIGIEKEADEFAAYLLMPFDDFRKRVSATDKPGVDELSACAERYGVSLVAAVMRWLEYTERRAILVVSRDGGAIWSKASDAAYRSGRFIRTAKQTFMLPAASLTALGEFDGTGRAVGTHPPGIWFPQGNGGDFSQVEQIRSNAHVAAPSKGISLSAKRRTRIYGYFREVFQPLAPWHEYGHASDQTCMFLQASGANPISELSPIRRALSNPFRWSS